LIGLFTKLLERLVAFGLQLAAALVKGILGAPMTAVNRMSMPVKVRRAGPEEVVELRWRVLRAGRPREDAVWDGDREPETRHWVAEHDGRVVGTATVLKRPMQGDPARPWQLRGMATTPEWQGKGVGGKVLDAVVTEVGDGLWCNARTTAAPFYTKAGWRTVGEPFDIAGVGLHVRMTR
jgi:GNAT superfamily N-acetyltransferase